METASVVHLLRHYRHDILNQLQVVQGYIQLGHLEKANAGMQEIFEYFNQERKLLSLNIPKVFVWLLTFNLNYKNYNLTYDMDIENKNLEAKDLYINEKFEQIMQVSTRYSDDNTLFNVEIEFKDSIDSCTITVYITGEMSRNNGFKEPEIADIEVNFSENEQIYRFQVAYP